MRERTRATRRILTASAGAAVFTALEGLACGNPVEPAYYREGLALEKAEADRRAAAAADAGADAAADAGDDAAADAGADAP